MGGDPSGRVQRLEYDDCKNLLPGYSAGASGGGGCGRRQRADLFFKILLPVCTPVIAVLTLWQFVAMWNSYFDAMIYLNDSAKQPLQLALRSILIQNQPESGMIADMQSTAARAQLAELLKYATIIISSLPLLIMYPFFQKYFDSGIMAGAVKG